MVDGSAGRASAKGKEREEKSVGDATRRVEVEKKRVGDSPMGVLVRTLGPWPMERRSSGRELGGRILENAGRAEQVENLEDIPKVVKRLVCLKVKIVGFLVGGSDGGVRKGRR